MSFGMNPFLSIDWEKAKVTVGDNRFFRTKRYQFVKNRTRYLKTYESMTESQREMEYILLRIERQVYFNDKNPVRKLSILSEKPEFSQESYNSSIQSNMFTHEIIKHGNTLENNAFIISFFCLDKNDAQISKESNDLNNELGFKENRRKFECNHLNCNKSYKNQNGLVYHLKYGHPRFQIAKKYKCGFPDCNKSYKNSNGLKYHRIHGHK